MTHLRRPVNLNLGLVSSGKDLMPCAKAQTRISLSLVTKRIFLFRASGSFLACLPSLRQRAKSRVCKKICSSILTGSKSQETTADSVLLITIKARLQFLKAIWLPILMRAS